MRDRHLASSGKLMNTLYDGRSHHFFRSETNVRFEEQGDFLGNVLDLFDVLYGGRSRPIV